jgi:hypothetical protein
MLRSTTARGRYRLQASIGAMQQPRHHDPPAARQPRRIFSFARSLRYFSIMAILQHQIAAETGRWRYLAGPFLG